MTLLKLVLMVYLVGIAGGSGSGKSTFTNRVIDFVDRADVIHINLDWYYLAQQPKELFIGGKPNFDHPLAFDWTLLKSQLSALRNGQQVQRPTYDYKISSRLPETLPLGPCRIAIVEGIYTLWDPEVRNLFDLKVFIDVEADIRFIRRLHRDVHERGRTLDSVITQYYDTVRPMHRQFLEPTSQFADVLVGEENALAAEVIAAKVREWIPTST